jgi:SNF2 family DNA or RNA helicase
MSLNIESFCEINEKGTRIEVHFRYSEAAVEAIKTVPGARFVPKDKGGPFWTIPLDMQSARKLRLAFGESLQLGEAVKEWGKQARARSRNLQSLVKSDDAQLERLPDVLPELAAWLRPFQRADVKFLAQTSALNANEQGLGKTVEAIAAVFEAGLDHGPQLIIAPKTSLETVWKYELDRWVGDPVYILSGDVSRQDWLTCLGKIIRHQKMKEPYWLVTTANQIRSGLDAAVANENWNVVIIDEFPKTGLTNVSGDPSKGTKFGRAVRGIKRRRLFLLSGTPIGGKPIKLWGALNHLNPEVFTSKWRWAETWLEIEDNGFGKKINGLLPHRVDEFYPEHAEYIIRRLKSEVLPQLPPKQYIDVWCDMLPAQKRQYEKMSAEAEVRIDDQRLSASGILAEYTRLKQFANAEQSFHNSNLLPKASGKLEPLIERLLEVGIDPDDPTGDNVAVVASESKLFIKWIAEQLNNRGIRTELITGDTKAKERASIIKRFQSGVDSPRVVAVTTTAGGVAITMDRADTVHILDETWNPDDQEQLEDRIHRISRIHQVMCYYYRSKGTVQEAIWQVAQNKKITNRNITDIRRQMFKEETAA